MKAISMGWRLVSLRPRRHATALAATTELMTRHSLHGQIADASGAKRCYPKCAADLPEFGWKSVRFLLRGWP